MHTMLRVSDLALFSSHRVAEEALLKMVRLLGADSYHVQVNPGKFIIVTEVVRVGEGSEDSSGGGGNNDGRQNSARGPGGVDTRSGSWRDQSPRGGSAGAGSVGRGRGDRTNPDLLSPRSGDDSHAEDGERNSEDDEQSGEFVERVLHFQCGNMFDVKNINTADIVMMETDIPQESHTALLALLSQMRPNTKILSYLDFRKLWANTQLTFQQLEVNRHQADRYPTSWSVQRGHHFYIWNRVSLCLCYTPPAGLCC